MTKLGPGYELEASRALDTSSQPTRRAHGEASSRHKLAADEASSLQGELAARRARSGASSRKNVHNVQNVQNVQNMQNVQNVHTGTEYRVSKYRGPGDRAGIPTRRKVPPPGARRPLWNFPLKLT